MARTAINASWSRNVIRWFTDRRRPVVAARAVARHTRVIKRRACKTNRVLMASIAILPSARDRMIGRFSDRS